MPGPLGRLDRALTRVEELLVFAAGALVFALMFYGTLDVLSRALFNRPLPSTYEYMELGMVAIVYLGIAQVQRLQGHVAVDDDPGRDLAAEGRPGHRFFFHPDEVDLLWSLPSTVVPLLTRLRA